MPRTIDLIYCAGGNKRFADIAISCGFLYGSQLPSKIYRDIYFADQNWKKPNKSVYIEEIKSRKPYMATVLDWEREEQFDEVIEWAEDVAPFVTEVLIIPKVIGGVHKIPTKIGGKKIRLAYSVPTKYAGTPVSLDEFQGRETHLLGGSPHKQMEIALDNLNVVSADGNYHQKVALNWGLVWVLGAKKNIGRFVALKDYLGITVAQDVPYVAFKLSSMNIKSAWEYLLK